MLKHFEALQETEGELIAVASTTKQRALEFSEPYGCEAIEGHRNLISLPGIDAIYIATPHTSHFEFAVECLKQKKFVREAHDNKCYRDNGIDRFI